MPSERDPWLAANLSWTFAGLGQLYAGRKLIGALFLTLDLLGMSVYVLWLASREFSFVLVIWALPAVVLLRIVALLHARAAKIKNHPRLEPSPLVPQNKNPWLSVFMTRFIPGLGHAYAGRWVRALILFLLFVAWTVWTPTPRWATAVFYLYSALTIPILIDSFRTLRASNVVPRRTTLGALFLILSTSQTFLLAKAIQTFG